MGRTAVKDVLNGAAVSIYLSSTTKTSPRQSLPMVQLEAPDSEPRLPIQSEDKMKNLPSCDTVPIAYFVLNRCDLAVMKV